MTTTPEGLLRTTSLLQAAGRAMLRVLLGALCWTLPAAAADIYVYEDGDGSRLITDHPRMEPGYRLIRVYSESKVFRQVNADPRPEAKPQASDYDALILRAAKRASLDPMLIKSVMQTESAFDPNAVSKKGASGLMQLMPGTADRYGVSQVFDPHQNVMGGARYLSDLLDLFNGDLKLALAGYNAGENAVIDRGGVPPFRETRRYINKVMRLYRAYQGERCAQHRDDLAAIQGTIISCSGSTRVQASGGVGISSLSTQNATGAAADVTADNTVSSADDGGWRVIE